MGVQRGEGASGAGVSIFGAVLLDQREQLLKIAGPSRFAAALDRLGPRQRADYEAIGFFSWTHHATATAVTVVVAEEIGWDPARLQETVVRQGIEKTFSTIWRMLLRFPSEAALMRRAAYIYSKTIRGGSMHAEVDGDRLWLVLEGWPDIPELDRVALRAGIEAILRLSGRPFARIETRADGPQLILEVRGDRVPATG